MVDEHFGGKCKLIKVSKEEFEEIKKGFRDEIERHLKGLNKRLDKYEVIK